ncbi:MAG: CvpA family protein [Chloroflexi bacterium]|nr:CvpA family protein [Chloroflexota bacterium]
MNWLDFVLLGTLVALGALGLRMGWQLGLIRGVLMLVGVAVGIFLAGRFSTLVRDQLTFISNHNMATVISFVIVIVAAVAVTWVLASLLRAIAQAMLMGWLDSLAGALLGLASAAAVFTAGVILLAANPVGGLERPLDDSEVAAFVVTRVPLVLRLLPEDFREALAHFSPVKEPKITVARLEVDQVTAQRAMVSARVQVENPNSFGGTLNHGEYTIWFYSQGQWAVLGWGDVKEQRIRPNATTTVNLVALSRDPAKASALLSEVEAKKSLQLRIDGTARLRFGTKLADLPFTQAATYQF